MAPDDSEASDDFGDRQREGEQEEEKWITEERAFEDLRLPDSPSEETLAWYGRLCRENRAAIEAWEACFDRVPPLPALDFSPGELGWSLRLPMDGTFVWMERSRLILALAGGDADAAWACYRRIGHFTALFRQMPIFSEAWPFLENLRLSCAEKLLKSRLLADARLDELDIDFWELERAVPEKFMWAIYANAVFVQDHFMSMEDGRIVYDAPEGVQTPGALAPYRWIFPQFWHFAALDKKETLKTLLSADLSFSHPCSDHIYFFSFGFLDVERFGHQFSGLIARTRGMRVLIRAERCRRRYGTFPQTLGDLPEDPLTGGKLIYEIGPAEIRERCWEKPVSLWTDHLESRMVEAVQVHSDPAAVEVKNLQTLYDESDATRALLRLGPSAVGPKSWTP